MTRTLLDIVQLAVLGLLVLDVLAVLTLPYAVLTARRGHGVSLMPAVGLDIVLALIAVGLAFAFPGQSWYNQPLKVLMYAGGLVAAGWVHFFAAIMIGGCVKLQLRHRRIRLRRTARTKAPPA